jgi:hypothetical protein
MTPAALIIVVVFGTGLSFWAYAMLRAMECDSPAWRAVAFLLAVVGTAVFYQLP